MIRVLIADDSAFLRQILTDVLDKSGKVKVVAAAKNGKEAIEGIKLHKPDLAIFDVEMPVMNGLEALRRVMDESPLPVLMFSSLTAQGASVTLKALEYGATDFLLKPTSTSSGLGDVANQLVRKIEAICLKSRFAKLGVKRPSAASIPTAAQLPNNLQSRRIDLVAMGSSTGGVQAAMEVVPKLPSDFPALVWVQHMPAQFTERFAQRLKGISQMKVKEAQNGDVIERGVCYLAPGGVQMQIFKNGSTHRLNIEGTYKKNGFCPSCDVLFESIEILSPTQNNVLGVILTGMGDDGAQGLKLLRSKGAYVIGQDEESCVVYGMPKAAFDSGGVDIQLDIKQIAPAMMKVCGIH